MGLRKLFAMTSGIVTRDRGKYWPLADQYIPCNNPRINCRMYFVSSSPLVSKEGNVASKVQLNLSTTATLETEENGVCREVETRVNVWTVGQKQMAIVERWPLWIGGRCWGFD